MAEHGRQLFEMLKKDHRQAEQMMKQIEAVPPEEREDIFLNLQEALQEHMRLEEKEFYPKIKNIPEMKDLVKDALHEHQETKELLSELEDMDCESDDWQETFQQMQEGIQHHVQDEEKEIFPRCPKILSEQQLSEITERCLREKEKQQPSRTARAGKAKTSTRTRKQPQL